MGYQQDRGESRLVDHKQSGEQHLGSMAVQRSGRFVRQQQPGIADQRSGTGTALKGGDKMKNRICIVLSFLLLFILTGCGNNGTGNGAESTLPQTDGQTEQSTDYEQEGSGTEMQESSEAVSEPEQESDMETKTLVVYFSATGTTKPLAEYAAEILNADLYEIVPEDPYTEEDLAYYTNGRADQEQNDSSARPAISGGVENMEEYDTILLGYPNMEHSFESVLCA